MLGIHLDTATWEPWQQALVRWGPNWSIRCTDYLCVVPFSAGAPVTIAAAPITNWTFNGWSCACSGTGTCALVMNGNQDVTATFRPFPFFLYDPPTPEIYTLSLHDALPI